MKNFAEKMLNGSKRLHIKLYYREFLEKYLENKMKTIHKVKIDLEDEQEIELPEESDILCAGMQHEIIYLWYLTLDSKASKVKRKIIIRGTGHQFPDGDYKYINTVMLYNGNLVYHVFERTL
jgi:hypothetical protein